MNSLPTQAMLGASVAIVAAALAASFGSIPLLVTLVSTAILAYVAFAAQSQRLRDEQRLVYRPVYVKRHDAQRRIRSDD